MALPSAAASIIVPAYLEAANLRELAERIFRTMQRASIAAEMIIVDDDSQDGTESLVDDLSRVYPVRLIIRRGERGLASAVLRGFREARYDRLVVLDADLQHPPEMIPVLLAQLDAGACDFAVATRYATDGGVEDAWPARRRIASKVAAWLARPLAPLSDPLSGFFALPRTVWEQADRLDPVGYKIGLELYVKGHCHRPGEVPIHFAARCAGKSKLTFAEQIRFLRHLFRLYRYRFIRR